ncbi:MULTISPECIES: ABC transporter permease [unclassified Nocardioides]|uniref:ABC transporter permease n=1 Tax=unclassified Nocardioides TaxID=2615069 RepID=UPI0006F4E12D|nr:MULTISPECIES: ABC transporter permease [unclassified Nocardioides]KRA32571.1 hypothetical protein ASD81_13595 [Nocardioides sp. Root614]KRA89224.1 hypothetical protein ASD84_13860 [Nocardioides sp. Root682]
MSAFLRLARVELSRLLHRRAALLLIAACLVVPIIIGVAVVLDTRPPSAQELADAQQQVEHDRNDPSFEEQVDECVAHPENWGNYPADLTDEETEKRCRADMEPQLDWYLYSPQLDVPQERDNGSGIAITLLLSMAMMLLGTTFTGHDWASGSVSNQLLFEPRRLRVWFAKALVVTGTAALLATVVQSSYWLAIGAVARSRDRLGDGVLLDCLQMGWRAAAVAGVAALLGFALTMLFRNTVATLGILFGIALAGGILLGVLGIEGRWNPAYNVAAVVTDGVKYYADGPCPEEVVKEVGGDPGGCSVEKELSFAQGAGFLGTAVVGTSLLSLLWFRRRDVP